jgi:SAM-dependent methyltransferase
MDAAPGHGEDRHRQRTSFGVAAGEYERARPGYPAAAVEWLTGRPARRVLDLGAGTGKLTRQLVDAGHDVVAVEPLAEMRRSLAAAVPGVPALDGTAEAIPLPDASVDVVVAGQAYHWFDPARAHPEIARVLRPGGTLGLVWNLRDDAEPWVAALSRLLGVEDSTGTTAPARRPDTVPQFTPVEAREFRHEHRLDRDGLLALVGSRSYVITMPPDERAALLARVDALARTHPDLAGRSSFTVPYRTRAFRARRLR